MVLPPLGVIHAQLAPNLHARQGARSPDGARVAINAPAFAIYAKSRRPRQHPHHRLAAADSGAGVIIAALALLLLERPWRARARAGRRDTETCESLHIFYYIYEPITFAAYSTTMK